VARLRPRHALVEGERVARAGDAGDAGQLVGDRQRARDLLQGRLHPLACFAARRRVADERGAIAAEPVVRFDVARLCRGERAQRVLVGAAAGGQPPLDDRVRGRGRGDDLGVGHPGREDRRAREADVQIHVERIGHRRRAIEALLELARQRQEAAPVGFGDVARQRGGIGGHELCPFQLLAGRRRRRRMRHEEPGLFQVLGGVDAELLLPEGEQHERAEQPGVVGPGGLPARRGQAEIADYSFVEAAVAALGEQAVGDQQLGGERGPARAAARRQDQDGERDRGRERAHDTRGGVPAHRSFVGTTRTGVRARQRTR
jgi:hypothetical protein